MNSTGRLNKYDNLKGFAILLVVLGHLCFYFNHYSVFFIHSIVNLVHLPIFFFVAGYFSKIGSNEPEKAFRRLLLPYIILCVVYWLFSAFVLNRMPDKPIFLYPGFALWFLISLFTMKMFLPIFDRLKHPIIIAFVLALLVGYINPYYLGISRTFVFMPIFLIGFYYKNLRAKISFDFENRYVTYLMAVIMIAVSVIVVLNVPFREISCKYHYIDPVLGILMRLIVLTVIILNVLVVHKLMSDKESILTKFGRNSYAVYLLHPYVVDLIQKIFDPFFTHHFRIYFIGIFFIAFIIVYVLSRDAFTIYLNRIFDACYNILSK